MNDDQPHEIRIIRMNEVIYRTGFSRPKIYSMLDENSRGYDPDFPKPVNLGSKAVGWMSDEITNWIITKVENSRGNKISGGQ